MDQVEEDREMKEHRDKDKLSKKRLAEKANNYAKYVREMYAPSVVNQDSVDMKYPNRFNDAKENYRQNNNFVSEDDVDSVNARKKFVPPRRGTTAENKYNNVKVNLPDNFTNPSLNAREDSLGAPSVDTSSNKRFGIPKSIRQQAQQQRNNILSNNGFNSEPEMNNIYP